MNTLMTKTLILSSLLTLTTWAYAAEDTATAQSSMHPKALFAQADKDGDGKLNSTEFAELQSLRDAEMAKRQAARPDFATLDKDGDGLVSQDEMRAGMKAHRGGRHGGRGGQCGGEPRQGMLSQADADKNGQLSQEELRAGMHKSVKMMATPATDAE